MSERSVAEIIGWTHVGYDDWVGLEWYSRPGEEQVQPSTEPTVDDLLAWLRGQGYDVTTKVMRFASDEPIVWAEAANRKVVKKARTLLAALEAAVRAVAGEA